MKTHLRPDTFQKQIDAGKVKVIVVIRNPKDTLVSFYHFYRMHRGLGNFQGSWDEFYELHNAKGLIFGDYFDWYAKWLEHTDKPNVELVKYEDMKRRMPEVIGRMCNFLGKPLSDDVIPDLINHLSFDSMKNNEMTNLESNPRFDTKVSPFMRKGQIGDWKNYFSDEQSAQVDNLYMTRIKDVGVTLEFQ